MTISPNRPTILVDVDEVVADLLGEWVRRYNFQWRDTLRVEDITEWNMVPFVKPGCGKDIYKILGQEDIYDYVETIPHALEGVSNLRAMGRVVFVTSANVATMKGKVHWLERHGLLTDGPRHDDLIIAHDKSLIRGDVLIDDGPHNIEAFPGPTVVFDTPYNRHVTGTRRAHGWAEVVSCVAKILAPDCTVVR